MKPHRVFRVVEDNTGWGVRGNILYEYKLDGGVYVGSDKPTSYIKGSSPSSVLEHKHVYIYPFFNTPSYNGCTEEKAVYEKDIINLIPSKKNFMTV